MPKTPTSIKAPARFKKIFQEGQKIFVKRASLFYFPARILQIGVTISRKQGIAVQRNRSRRLIKEYFRLHQEKIEPVEAVVVLKKPLPQTYIETSQIMLKLLRKAGLLK